MDAFLEVPDILLLPQLNLLQSSTHRSIVQKRSFNVIVAIYKQLYERIHDPESQIENPDVIFTKNPDKITELLQDYLKF